MRPSRSRAGSPEPAVSGAAASPPSRPAPVPLDARRARLVAAELLSRRAWTRAELARRLTRRGAPAPVVAEVVADLVARGYLDDAAFARRGVEARSSRGYGPARLRAELRARGVEPDVIEAALASPSAADPLGPARDLARRRLPALRRGRPERLAARLRDVLLRRGFAPETVERVVREVAGPAAGPGQD